MRNTIVCHDVLQSPIHGMVLISGHMAVGGEGVRLFASESYDKRLKAQEFDFGIGFWGILGYCLHSVTVNK